MNYQVLFWMLVAWVIARGMPRNIYIGSDAQKYAAADTGILLRKR